MKTDSIWPWIVLGAILIACFLFRSANVGNIQISSDSQIPQISVSGEGEVMADPDEAYVYVRVVTQDKVAAEAQRLNQEKSNVVKESFKRNGLSEKDIETSTYYVNPETRYYPPKDFETDKETYKIVGYTVTHTFKITVKDLDTLGKIVDDAVSVGANGVDNVAFGLSKEKEIQVKGQALSLAAKKAQEKAKSISGSLGVRLGKVLSASESGGYTPYYARYESKALAMDGAGAPTPITPGKVDVQTTVSIVYEIEQ